ncbi:MAG: hypothetical protein KAI29_21860, partial [Cyclobacteriaceae bacterium]|nr:hypothetical protein [Cyclobacteriaceae bacterium]
QDYNVSITGGSESSTYAVGAGYSSQENAMYKSKLDRYSFFANSDHKLTKWLKIGESFRLAISQTDVKPDVSLEAASLINPWQPLFDANGMNGYALPGGDVAGTFEPFGYGNSTRNNFLGQSDYSIDRRNLIRNLGSFYAEISPIEGLRFRGTISLDFYTNTNERFTQEEEGYFTTRGAPNTDGTTFRRRINENRNLILEFLIGYQKTFGNHNIDLVLNATDQKIQWNNEQSNAKNTGLLDWDQRRIDEGWPPEDKGLFYERTNYGLLGYMGRLSYNYNSKYYFDATVRRDGTSRFGTGYKWGTFPSFAAAWRISSEEFMQSVTFINDLKIRVGWGKTGNQETRDFAFLSLVNFNPKYALGSNGVNPGEGNIVPAAALGDFPIVDMSWETVTTQNIGFDALFWKNKISLTAEYYFRETEGILQAIEIPKVIGALTQPVVNLATVENKGIELVVGYNDNFGDLGFNANLNF